MRMFKELIASYWLAGCTAIETCAILTRASPEDVAGRIKQLVLNTYAINDHRLLVETGPAAQELFNNWIRSKS